jgi:hypothetical protein
MNENQFDRFIEAYAKALPIAVANNPEDYAYGVSDAPKVVEKMGRAIRENPRMVNWTNSPGFRLACKDLGIKYNVKSIFAFLEV